MGAALLDDLLAAFTGPTPAKAANPANRVYPCGPAPESYPCEDLRKVASPATATDDRADDSQKFAAVRRPGNRPGSETVWALSQDSQDSQVVPTTCAPIDSLEVAAVAWTAADIAAFLNRRARLLRWGWAEPEATALAERLAMRDRTDDDRVSCIDCALYRPDRCGNHRRAGLHGPSLGRDLAAMLQRCRGFQAFSSQRAELQPSTGAHP